MRILGISAFYHDSAAALIEDGRIVAAAQEERFTRKKYDSSYPANAIAYCLAELGIQLADVDYVAFYDKPFLKFTRLLETYLAFAPKGFASFRTAMPLWLKDKLFQRKKLDQTLRAAAPDFDWRRRLLFSEHHLSHAASAFFPSPFDHAVILTMDGVGEWATTSAALGDGNRITMLKEIHFPHSLGLLYSAFTDFTGFRVNSGEYKVMGLAPYGEPRFAQVILDHLIDLKEDGSIRLDQRHFDYCTGLRMTNDSFRRCSVSRHASRRTRSSRCIWIWRPRPTGDRRGHLAVDPHSCRRDRRPQPLSGGRCRAQLRRQWQGAARWPLRRCVGAACRGRRGGALGAALGAYHLELGRARRPSNEIDSMSGSYLGPAFDDDEIGRRLTAAGARFARLGEEELLDQTVNALAVEKAVGWFQGRMEFGPRALGARSILADARSPRMQRILNLKVKYRESFRPFAPSVLREDVGDWFELDRDSPYMLIVADVAVHRRRAISAAERDFFGIDKLNVPRSEIPAVTHVDFSARIQTVHRETNPRYHALLTRFKALTGCPVLVNTSFNVRGEPIACTPEDAFRCFMGSEIDCLAIGNFFLHKADQDPALRVDYRDRFDPD